MDNLIKISKSATDNIVFKYSTATEYYHAVMAEINHTANLELPTYTEDFMPLDQLQTDHFWTGYYTSRPNFKKYIRDLSGLT